MHSPSRAPGTRRSAVLFAGAVLAARSGPRPAPSAPRADGTAALCALQPVLRAAGRAAMAAAFSAAIMAAPAHAISGGGKDFASRSYAGADFSAGDYSGKDFSGGLFRGANFAGSNLREARFFKAELREADLSGADLSFATIESAVLRAAVLRDAVLAGAYISDSILEAADIYSADFSDALISPQSTVTKLCQRDDARGVNPVTKVGTRESMIVAHLPHLASKRIVLASQSPRRSEILRLMGLSGFTVTPSKFDEATLDKGAYAGAELYVQASASAKMREVVARSHDADLVLAADTVVVVDGRILEKPPSEGAAVAMLRTLSGRSHVVATGVAMRTRAGREVVFAERTTVTFAKLDDDAVAAYVRSGEPLDKAGAYGIQGIGGTFVERIDGCFFNVMGLPMHRVAREIATLVEDGAI